MGLSIVAKRDDDCYLIAFDDGLGCVFDATDGTLYPEHTVLSILAHGYWNDIDHVPANVLEQVRNIFSDEVEHGKTTSE